MDSRVELSSIDKTNILEIHAMNEATQSVIACDPNKKSKVIILYFYVL